MSTTHKRPKPEMSTESNDKDLLSCLFDCCKKVSKNLPAPYDTSVYYAALDEYLMSMLNDHQAYYKRNVLVCITAAGSSKVLGSLKVPLVIFNSKNEAVIAADVSTKKTALKSTDMNSMKCYVDQMGAIANIKPIGCLVRLFDGAAEGLILHRDSTLEEIINEY